MKLKYAIKETPARLKLAALIDQRNVAEEQMRGLAARAETSQEHGQIAIRLSNIETSVRLTEIDVILEEVNSAVSELDAAAKAIVHQVSTVIRTLDDFTAVTKASGCEHGVLQPAYAEHARLNGEVDKIGAKLIADINMAAAEAAALKWSGASSGESALAALARELRKNPMARLS